MSGSIKGYNQLPHKALWVYPEGCDDRSHQKQEIFNNTRTVDDPPHHLALHQFKHCCFSGMLLSIGGLHCVHANSDNPDDLSHLLATTFSRIFKTSDKSDMDLQFDKILSSPGFLSSSLTTSSLNFEGTVLYERDGFIVPFMTVRRVSSLCFTISVGNVKSSGSNPSKTLQPE